MKWRCMHACWFSIVLREYISKLYAALWKCQLRPCKYDRSNAYLVDGGGVEIPLYLVR